MNFVLCFLVSGVRWIRCISIWQNLLKLFLDFVIKIVEILNNIFFVFYVSNFEFEILTYLFKTKALINIVLHVS